MTCVTRDRRTLRGAFLALCALVVVPAIPTAAQETGADPRPRLSELRERWEAKTPEERALLRRRFDEWRELEPERREELLERARRWRQEEERERASADEGLKRELEHLPPPERERRWREHALERFRERGRRLLERLPAPVRSHLEQAPPGKRREALGHFLGRREERTQRALRHVGRRLGLTPERVRELEQLPPEERRRQVLELLENAPEDTKRGREGEGRAGGQRAEGEPGGPRR
jgi:hypothetical protein